MRRVLIPVPPLNEQRRIVAKLDSLFARSRRAREELERIPKLCDRYKQAILAAAFRGDLTADWREENLDIEPASELLKQAQERFKQTKKTSQKDKSLESTTTPIAGLPTWIGAKLDILLPPGGIFDGPFGSNLKTEDYRDFGVRVIRLENISTLEFINSKESYKSHEKYEALKKHTVYEGDLIFASFTSDGSRACILPRLETTAIAKADCFVIRPDLQVVDKNYLCIGLVSEFCFDQLKELTHGATRPRINTTQLRSVIIPLCPIDEQKEIVQRIEKLFQVIDSLWQEYQKASKLLDRLDQATLAKAFRGELVPQDPNDKPAAALLERILAERQQPKSKAVKSKQKPGGQS